MAKVGIDFSLTPENTELESGIIRRNSTGKIGFQTYGPKILSRYLRTSMGSCHDFCKYGIKHASEANEKSPMPKKITAALEEGQYLEKVPTLAKKKEKMSLICKASPDSKTRLPDHPFIIKIEASTSDKKVAVPRNDSSFPGNGNNDSKQKHLATRPSSISTPDQMSDKRNSHIIKSKKMEALLKDPLEGPSIPRNGEIGIKKVMGEREVSMHPAVSFSPKTFVRRVSTKRAENLKGAHLKNRNNALKAKAVQVSDESVPEKTLHIIDPDADRGSPQDGSRAIRSSQSLTPSSEGKGLRRSSNKIQSTRSSGSSGSKSVKSTQNGIGKTQLPPSLPSSSEKKSLRHPQNGTHRTRLSSSSPLSSTVSLSESTITEQSGAFSKHNQTKPRSKHQTSKRKTKVDLEGVEYVAWDTRITHLESCILGKER